MKELRDRVYNQVKAAVMSGRDIKVGPVEMKVLDCDKFVYVTDFGRVEKAENYSGPGSISSLQSEVISRVKAAFRDAGPEAALAAIEAD